MSRRFGASFVAPSANVTRLGGCATLAMRADAKIAEGWTLGLKLNNLGNKQYETVQGYNRPGRELFVSLRYAR